MFIGVDGRFEVGRSEAWRSRQDHGIHTALQDLLMGIETNKAVVRFDLNAPRYFARLV